MLSAKDTTYVSKSGMVAMTIATLHFEVVTSLNPVNTISEIHAAVKSSTFTSPNSLAGLIGKRAASIRS